MRRPNSLVALIVVTAAACLVVALIVIIAIAHLRCQRRRRSRRSPTLSSKASSPDAAAAAAPYDLVLTTSMAPDGPNAGTANIVATWSYDQSPSPGFTVMCYYTAADVTTVTVPPDAFSHTFTNMVPGQDYNVVVTSADDNTQLVQGNITTLTCVNGIYGPDGATTSCCPFGGHELCDLYHYCTGQPPGSKCGAGNCDGVCSNGACVNGVCADAVTACNANCDRSCQNGGSCDASGTCTCNAEGCTTANCTSWCGKQGLGGANCLGTRQDACSCDPNAGDCDSSICAANNTCPSGFISACAQNAAGCTCVPACNNSTCDKTCGMKGFPSACGDSNECVCNESRPCSTALCQQYAAPCAVDQVAYCTGAGCACMKV